MNPRLGCVTGTGLLAALVTPFLVASLAGVTGGEIFSPGPLSAVRAEAPLGGVSSHTELACSGCHTPFWSGERMGERCLACHSDIQAELTDLGSLHGQLADPGNCRDCHTEHQGPEAALTRFDSQGFPHEQFGFSLQAHAANVDGRPFACDDCHSQSIRTFELKTCNDCHLSLDRLFGEEHTRTFGLGCLNCHDGIDSYGSAFDHDRVRFPLLGKHAVVPCADCHAGSSTIAALQSTPETCIGCHQADDAHQGRLGPDCATCHTVEDWHATVFDHAQTGFPLAGAHAAIACQDCHVNGQLAGIPRACVACHKQDDVHEGRLGSDCETCHTASSWTEIIDENFDHQRTRFDLTGAHIQVTCLDCHRGGQFAGTPMQCIACHQKDDVHRGQYGSDCASCHNTASWKGASFDHGRTAFPLTGAHVSAACNSCHVNGIYRGTPTACVACHAEPAYHFGLFGSDCQSCHNTRTWVPASYNQEHGFPLNHGDANGSCETCHPSALSQYTCFNCHKHEPEKTARKHLEKGIPDISNCANCHPNGKKEESGN